MIMDDQNVNNVKNDCVIKYDQQMIDEQEQTVNEEQEVTEIIGTNSHSSGFMLEILLCSFLLWSFLFFKSNVQYKSVLFEVDEMLSAKANITMIDKMQEEVSEVMRLLLS